MLCISQGGHSDGGFMVRLSSRSPKDAAIPSREMYDAEVARLLSEGAPDDTNTSLRAYFEASGRVLRIDDAEGAVNLLSASERVHRDLHEALTARQIYSMKVAIRAWEPSLLQEYEFRGFVYGHKLTALSQYNPYCFYPEQVRKRDELVARLATFWRESVRDNLIGVFDGGYIVDLAILSTGDVVVIELNPFDEQTGAGVFSWQADRELLEHGPLALRLLEAPRPNMESTIEAFISELPRPARQGGSTEPAAVVESAQRSDADEPTPAQACVVL